MASTNCINSSATISTITTTSFTNTNVTTSNDDDPSISNTKFNSLKNASIVVWVFLIPGFVSVKVRLQLIIR